MTEYINALLGGALIGTSALVMMLFFGRITGISGILFSGVNQLAQIKGERSSIFSWLFVAGLIIGAALYYSVSKTEFPSPVASMPLAIISGFLVGFGTKLGSGCTSGHGVCGISRFSFRSLTATFVFMLFGMLATGAIRHVI